MIELPYAPSDPKAVVIELVYASVALGAMPRSVGLLYLADLTEPFVWEAFLLTDVLIWSPILQPF